jgi:WD40 repeat protein
MVRNAGTCLYKEARLNIEPAFPGSTISITLPAKSANAIGFSTQPKRAVYDERDTGNDDDAFTKRHLASDGSVYFRRRQTYPRSFLWRVLDERNTLEIQAVDLENDERSTHEANLTLLLHFSSPIRPFCVAFAESDDQDSITTFVITTTNELYTLCIPCSFFSKETASDADVNHWCKRTTPALFHSNIPYRLVAVGIDQLLVSLDSGSILRLVREHKNETLWTEATFQHSNWSLTLRGVLPWIGQQKVRFGTADLAASTATDMSLSPDGNHILSVCLDHTLRIFNVQSGKLTGQQDLLDVADGAQDRNQSHLLGPSHPKLMQILEAVAVPNISYFVVVYSPIQHEFKFYSVRSADAASPDSLVDIQPDFSFVPPIDDLMNATVWTLEEFYVVPSAAGWKGTELWLRARSGPSSRVFHITFDPSDDSECLPRVWKNDWTTVDSGPLTIEGLRKEPMNPGEQEWDSSELYEMDISQRWLNFLFVPERFTVATLETALYILRKGIEGDRSATRPKGSLKDRLCTTIAEAVRRHAPEDTR